MIHMDSFSDCILSFNESDGKSFSIFAASGKIKMK